MASAPLPAWDAAIAWPVDPVATAAHDPPARVASSAIANISTDDERAAALDLDEARITADVLEAVARRIDLMFAYRVREAVAPALARLADQLVQETRDTVADTVRDVVARAVAQELARRRQRSK